jgi:hypothetical protein
MRPKASDQNKQIALAFAQCVTTGATEDDLLARHGSLSIYSAFCQVLPALARDSKDFRGKNRQGLTEIEFNKFLERQDAALFVKRRTRFVAFHKITSEPQQDGTKPSDSNVGSWMFSGLRWRDPGSSSDMSDMRAKLQAAGNHANLFDEKKIVEVVRSIRQEWLQLLSALWDMKPLDLGTKHASSSSTSLRNHPAAKRRRLLDGSGTGAPHESESDRQGSPSGDEHGAASLPSFSDIVNVVKGLKDGSGRATTSHASSSSGKMGAAQHPQQARQLAQGQEMCLQGPSADSSHMDREGAASILAASGALPQSLAALQSYGRPALPQDPGNVQALLDSYYQRVCAQNAARSLMAQATQHPNMVGENLQGCLQQRQQMMQQNVTMLSLVPYIQALSVPVMQGGYPAPQTRGLQKLDQNWVAAHVRT